MILTWFETFCTCCDMFKNVYDNFDKETFVIMIRFKKYCD